MKNKLKKIFEIGFDESDWRMFVIAFLVSLLIFKMMGI